MKSKEVLELIKQFYFANGYFINKVFLDVASGINFEKIKSFFTMLDYVISRHVERVKIRSI